MNRQVSRWEALSRFRVNNVIKFKLHETLLFTFLKQLYKILFDPNPVRDLLILEQLYFF